MTKEPQILVKKKGKKPYIGMGAFPKPGGEAAHEFERIIRCGPNSMCQFPKRILPAIEQAIAAEQIGDIAHGWSVTFGFINGDFLAEGAGEQYGASEEEMLGWHSNLLALRGLLLAIENGLEMNNLTRRVQVFQKLIGLFWTVFLVPMLRADGVSKSQANRRNRTGNATKRINAATRMHRNNSSRTEIVKYLVATFHPLTPQQARIDCNNAGIPGKQKGK